MGGASGDEYNIDVTILSCFSPKVAVASINTISSIKTVHITGSSKVSSKASLQTTSSFKLQFFKPSTLIAVNMTTPDSKIPNTSKENATELPSEPPK